MSSNSNRAKKDRWARVAMLVLLVFCCAGCGSPKVREPTRFIPDWRVYYNREVGVEFQYPYTLSLDVDTIAVEGQLNAKLTWTGRKEPVFSLVTSAAQPDRPVDAEPTDEVDEVDGIPASRSTSVSDDNDKEIQRVELTFGERLFIFTGAGDSFEKVLQTVKFIDPNTAPPLVEDE